MFKGPQETVQDNNSLSYSVFELLRVNCISKSVDDSNYVTARSILFLSNFSGPVKRFYKCRSVKAVYSSNISKQSVT